MAALQNTGLLSSKGLLPGNSYMMKIERHTEDIWEKINYAPTLLWFINYQQYGDTTYIYTMCIRNNKILY